MSISRTLVSSAVVLGVCGTAIAGPEVMDFQHLEHGGGAAQHGNPVIEDSFKVTTSTYFWSWGTPENHYAGSTGLMSNGYTITLTKGDAGSFSIQSIDLANYTYGASAGTPVNFVGTFAGGGTIAMGVSLPGNVGSSPSFMKYDFSSAWTGLSKVEWANQSGYHQFDNIVLDSPLIPLPTGAAMAMVGMGVIGVRRRRS